LREPVGVVQLRALRAEAFQNSHSMTFGFLGLPQAPRAPLLHRSGIVGRERRHDEALNRLASEGTWWGLGGRWWLSI